MSAKWAASLKKAAFGAGVGLRLIRSTPAKLRSPYTDMDRQLASCETAREGLVQRALSVLQAAETGRTPLDPFLARSLTERAVALIRDASTLASDSTPAAHEVCG
jgi:hypothetical protein